MRRLLRNDHVKTILIILAILVACFIIYVMPAVVFGWIAGACMFAAGYFIILTCVRGGL